MDVNGDGPPLVLVHGVATSRSIWRHVVPGLAERHLVATPDMPGFGGSPPIGRGFVLEEVADTLTDALAALPAPSTCSATRSAAPWRSCWPSGGRTSCGA